MGGYHICSLDHAAFHQITTAPTIEQALAFADAVLEEMDDLMDYYDDESAADVENWPDDRKALSKVIQQRLAAPDWYADFTMGDAEIWDTMLRRVWDDDVSELLDLDFQCENDGFLWWDAAERAAKHGAKMMAEPKFGGNGFRYSGKSKGELDLMYSIYLPEEVQTLLKQLEKVTPIFESLPEDDTGEGEREQFFDGLLDPVRDIASAGRVMLVQTDT